MRSLVILVVLVLSAPGLSRADPCQVARLLAPEPYAPTSFGNSIARSGDYWFIADYRAQVLCTGFGCGAGAVYVYQMVDGELVYVQTLTSPFPQSPDNYGVSIDANDEYLVVGAQYSAVPSRGDRPGAVFVYRNDGGHWRQASIVEPPVGANQFGAVVSLHSNTLAAADYDNDRILVYLLDGDNWQFTDEILPPSEVSAMPAFGWSIEASEGVIIIGSPYDRSRVGAGGSFHIYREVLDGQYEIEHSEYSSEQQLLGTAVAVFGDELFVGAMAATRQFVEQGVVHRYLFDGDRWNKADEILSEQAAFRRVFGANLEIESGVLAITARREQAVYLFEKGTNGQWSQRSRLQADTSTYPDFFGYAMEMDGDTLLIGAFNESDTFGSPLYGAAYHFDLSCGACAVDLDEDGRLTIFDFLAFLNLFEDGDAAADFDGDGELTVFDFLAFQTAFDAGCE